MPPCPGPSPIPNSPFLAHSANPHGEAELLRDHLAAVADRAASFASHWGGEAEARIAGLLHDLGKYGERFQRRLSGQEHGIDHWWAGAWQALQVGKRQGIGISLAVEGHHIGLQCGNPASLNRIRPQDLLQHHPLGLRLSDANGDLALLADRMDRDGISLPTLHETCCDAYQPDHDAAFMLDVRMLFSALVDADFLETERHFDPDCPRPEGHGLQPDEMLRRLGRYREGLADTGVASSRVAQVRADLCRTCQVAAEMEPGLFTLTAPTGSGKTLSMLEFALRHAQRHGLRRIITVLPYLSIIDQTVNVYRQALSGDDGTPPGDADLLEHHSLAATTRPVQDGENSESDAGRAVRRLTENWDAPLVVTTSVQLLESLFAARTSACRKLHRLAQSIILLDEVQTLPPSLLLPTLATFSWLAHHYGATVVFGTATQPAFASLDAPVRRLAETGWSPREIVARPDDLFARARRVRVTWDTQRACTWPEIADGLTAAAPGIVHDEPDSPPSRALVIVNLKRHALALYDEMKSREYEGLFHLATSMCPAHRRTVLDEVRRRLRTFDEGCFLVATQCVEAGVDLDFPKVLRALGPLDAIAQAAGRCNRNQLLTEGDLRVFLPVDERYPTPEYRQATDVTRRLLQRYGEAGLDLDQPGLFDEYYRELYAARGPESMKRDLQEAIEQRDFPKVQELYRLIPDNCVNVLVPFDRAVFDDLSTEIRNGKLNRDWVRRARPYSVNVYRSASAAQHLEPVPLARNVMAPDWFLLLDPDHYSPDTGLQLPGEAEFLNV